MSQQLGSFAQLFEPSPTGNAYYMSLLALDGDNAREALERVAQGLKLSPHSEDELVTLLYPDRGWRQNLVGLTGVVLRGSFNRLVAALWKAFDAGSWVMPQLAVAAFLRDPDFDAQAKRRIEAASFEPNEEPLSRPPISPEEAIARANLHGPDDWAMRTSKGVAALFGLLGEDVFARAFLQAQYQRRDIQRMLELHETNFGAFAIRWMKSLHEVAKDIGRPLEPPARNKKR